MNCRAARCIGGQQAISRQSQRHASQYGEWTQKKKATYAEERAKKYWADPVKAREQNREYYHKNPRNEERHAERLDPKKRAAALVQGAKHRAGYLGLEFSLDREHIRRVLEDGTCEATGISFVMTVPHGKRSPWAPSLDRFDPTKGYTKENTKVVVLSYNRAKGEYSAAEMGVLARAIVAREPS